MNKPTLIMDAVLNMGEMRTWVIIDPNEVSVAITDRRQQIVERHQAEVQRHEEAKPESTARVPELEGWEMAGTDLRIRHEQELGDFDRQSDCLVAELRTVDGLIGDYDKRFYELQQALENARTSAEADLLPLNLEKEELRLGLERVEKSREEVVAMLRKIGVDPSSLDERFEGWESEAKRAYYKSFCQSRGIDPDNTPKVPERPKTPKPMEIQNERTPKQSRINWSDSPMIVSGIFFALSLCAAVGAIWSNSEGWHFTALICSMMFPIGVAGTYFTGKKVFPALLKTILIDTIDLFGYMRSPEEAAEWQKMTSKAVLRAKLGLLGIFGILIAVDFYGWWRVMTDHNNTVVGDEGSLLYNPFIAGFVMMCMSTMFAAAKLAVVKMYEIDPLRERLIAEAYKNTAEWKDRTAEYNDDLEDYDAARKQAAEYAELSQAGRANAEYRFSRESGLIRDRIEEHLLLLDQYDPSRFDAIDAQIRQRIEEAEDEVEPARQALAKVECQIDGIHDRTNAMLNGTDEVTEAPAEQPLLIDRTALDSKSSGKIEFARGDDTE